MSFVDWLCRDPESGRLVIVQPPNLPLGVFLAASVARWLTSPDGNAATAVSVVAGVGLVGWAGDEVLRGESRFRRILGAVVLVAFVIGRLA